MYTYQKAGYPYFDILDEYGNRLGSVDNETAAIRIVDHLNKKDTDEFDNYGNKIVLK